MIFIEGIEGEVRNLWNWVFEEIVSCVDDEARQLAFDDVIEMVEYFSNSF